MKALAGFIMRGYAQAALVAAASALLSLDALRRLLHSTTSNPICLRGKDR